MPWSGTLDTSTSSQRGRVTRIQMPGHTFVVGDVLFRDANDTTWEDASLIDLAKFDHWLVVAVGPDWFEIPSIRGNITVPGHGWGGDGELFYLDWRIDGRVTGDDPPVGARRYILGRVVNINTIDYSPENSFMVVT